MIRVSVMYPNGDDATFDFDYYVETHMKEIVTRDMGIDRFEVDKPIDGPYVAVGHLYYGSLEAMQAGVGNSAAATADVPNFTNATPVMQVAEVLS